MQAGPPLYCPLPGCTAIFAYSSLSRFFHLRPRSCRFKKVQEKTLIKGYRAPLGKFYFNWLKSPAKTKEIKRSTYCQDLRLTLKKGKFGDPNDYKTGHRNLNNTKWVVKKKSFTVRSRRRQFGCGSSQSRARTPNFISIQPEDFIVRTYVPTAVVIFNLNERRAAGWGNF